MSKNTNKLENVAKKPRSYLTNMDDLIANIGDDAVSPPIETSKKTQPQTPSNNEHKTKEVSAPKTDRKAAGNIDESHDNTVGIYVKVPESLRTKLKMTALQEGVTLQNLIISALEKY